ncbi:MAG: hypothetical protein RQ826_15875, partial [Xanthomonadales bacterium]|nr:hypothetical protein [Xanthomonadales bacterium]
LAQGEPYVKICEDAHMPDFSTIWRWEQSNPDFGRQAQVALEHGTHFLAHDCLRIADAEEIDPRHKKIMIDTRIRLIGKWNAKRYGEKLQVDQRTELHEATDEELHEAIQKQFQSMAAQGVDLAGMLKDAGVEF